MSTMEDLILGERVWFLAAISCVLYSQQGKKKKKKRLRRDRFEIDMGEVG